MKERTLTKEEKNALSEVAKKYCWYVEEIGGLYPKFPRKTDVDMELGCDPLTVNELQGLMEAAYLLGLERGQVKK